MGLLLTAVTALASWVIDQTQGMVVVVLHSPMFWVYCSRYQLKRFYSFKSSEYHTIVEQLDRFDVVVMDKPHFMLPIEPPSFCRNHFHFEVSMEVSVPNVPKYINDVPEYFVLESLYYSSVARLRASP